MHWTDEAIVLGSRRHGETSVILELMTAAHGRHLGLVRGGRSRRMQPVLQPGNGVRVEWRARLDEHLGNYSLEAGRMRAARLMEGAASLYGLQLMAAHLRLLPERDPHPGLYAAMNAILEALDEPLVAGELLVRFELAMLEELGFGLDLAQCAATGGNDDLAYVSPKTGRAVSRSSGEPYADRLLALPVFLTTRPHAPDAAALAEGFALTGYFLDRHVWSVRAAEAPPERAAFVSEVTRSRWGADADRAAGRP